MKGDGVKTHKDEVVMVVGNNRLEARLINRPTHQQTNSPTTYLTHQLNTIVG